MVQIVLQPQVLHCILPSSESLQVIITYETEFRFRFEGADSDSDSHSHSDSH